jgi:hypothetical protein
MAAKMIRASTEAMPCVYQSLALLSGADVAWWSLDACGLAAVEQAQQPWDPCRPARAGLEAPARIPRG